MIHDPHDPSYLDEADVRHDLTVVFDRCGASEQLGAAAPLLSSLLDRYGGDAGRFTPAEQDDAVDECFPARWYLLQGSDADSSDAPSVTVRDALLRANAMRLARGYASKRARTMVRLLRHGGDAMPAMTRGIIRSSAGLTSARPLPVPAPQRFSEWFVDRTSTQHRGEHEVTVFAAGPYEWFAPNVGRDLVAVLERHGVSCSATTLRGSGVALLESGAVDRFARLVGSTVEALAADVRAGREIIVLDATTAHAVRQQFPIYAAPADRADAAAVAARTFTPAEYLLRLQADASIDPDGSVLPDELTYLRAPYERGAGADLLSRCGIAVRVVEACPGVDSLWGLREVYDDPVERLTSTLVDRIDGLPGGVVVSEHFFAHSLVADRTGRAVSHPISLFAGGTANRS